jgi:hypothetical protein
VSLLSSSRRRTGPHARLRASAALSERLTRRVGSVLTPLRLAQSRTGVGVVMLTRPALLPRGMGVDRVSAERTGWVVQMLGAREVALGAGTWLALRRPDSRGARLWIAAGVLSDAVDALAVAGALGRGRVGAVPGAGLVVVASTAAAVGVAALTDDERPRDAVR